MTDDLNALADRCDEVVAGLTKAQREAVCEGLHAPGHWRNHAFPRSGVTAGWLHALGMTTRAKGASPLTPLGLAVRARLTAQQEGQR